MITRSGRQYLAGANSGNSEANECDCGTVDQYARLSDAYTNFILPTIGAPAQDTPPEGEGEGGGDTPSTTPKREGEGGGDTPLTTPETNTKGCVGIANAVVLTSVVVGLWGWTVVFDLLLVDCIGVLESLCVG